MERNFFNEFFRKEEVHYLESHRSLCKEIISKQGLVFWTRFLISCRQQTKNELGPFYMSQFSDFVFINLLRMLSGGNKGSGKFLSCLCASAQLMSLRSFLPNVQAFIDAQKTSQRSALKKSIEDMLPPKLLQACDEFQDGISCPNDKLVLKFQLYQVLSVYLRTSGCVVSKLQQLAKGKTSLDDWKMPQDWSRKDYHPQELEEYLRDKWRDSFARDVVQLPIIDIAWWSKKKAAANHESPIGKKMFKLRIMQSFTWKPEVFAKVPTCLTLEQPKTLFTILMRHHEDSEDLPFDPLSNYDFSKMEFDCFQLAVPPILALNYHKMKVGGQHSLKISSWFASWCIIFPHKEFMKHMMSSSPKGKCANMEKKQHYLAIQDSLRFWTSPEALQPADGLSSTMDFLESAAVRRQFFANFTIRQQWFAVALFAVLKFEVQTVPLRAWPIPVKHAEAVKEVLSLVKMVKELVLLGLYCHENDLSEDLVVFFSKFMPVITNCLKLMGSKDWTVESLQGLKTECMVNAKKGTYIHFSYFELDKDIEEFYSAHPWNFLYYQESSSKGTFAGKIAKPMKKADESLRHWSEAKNKGAVQNIPYLPRFKGLLNNDAYSLIRTNSWNKKGKFIKEMVGAITCIGYVPWDDAARMLEYELNSSKFHKPLEAMKDGDYSSMKLVGKIGCHCLVLLNCVNKFQVPGRVLAEIKSQTLIGSIVQQSFDLFEFEHLHRLALLMGQMCDFEPLSPLKGKEANYTPLITAIKMMRPSATFELPDPFETTEQITAEAPILVESGPKACSFWLKKKLLSQLKSLYKESSQGNEAPQHAPIMQYLFPCYIQLLDSSNLGKQGIECFYQLLVNLLSRGHAKGPSQEVFPGNLLVNTRATQNKLLQIVNAVIDNMNGELCLKLAEIFTSADWCFANTHMPLCKTLAYNSASNYQNIWNIHLNILTDSCARLVDVNLDAAKMAKLSPAMSRLCVMHRATYSMFSMLSLELNVNQSSEFKKAMEKVISYEKEANCWRSLLYLRISKYAPRDGKEKQFVEDATEVMRNLWKLVKSARMLVKSKMLANMTNLPKNSYGNSVSSFLVGDVEIIEGLFGLKSKLCSEPDARPRNEPIEKDEQVKLAAMKGLFSDILGVDKNMAEEMCVEAYRMFRAERTVCNCCPHSAGDDYMSAESGDEYDSEDSEGNRDHEARVKCKKFLKPTKEVMKVLEQKSKEKERRTCNVCKKKESNKLNYFTCKECLKTDFPDVNHFCSKLCEKKAWEEYHEEDHVLHELDKRFLDKGNNQESKSVKSN